MQINKTNKEKHQASAKDLALKLKQENKMFKDLRTHFMHLANKFGRAIARGEDVIPKKLHRDEMKEIIHHHYKDTASKFSKNLRNKMGDPDNHPKVFDSRINHQIDIAAEKQSNESADQIANTTHDNMHSALKKVTVAAAAAGLSLTNMQRSTRAKDEFYDLARSRVPLIATTEVQRASESGKFIEMQELVNGDAYFENTSIQDMEKTKTWVAILDDHTREWHADADGQEVPFDRSFEVNGEELDMPGDDSLGASPDNVCNCRCAMVYSIDKS
jgi:hypothetical protein